MPGSETSNSLKFYYVYVLESKDCLNEDDSKRREKYLKTHQGRRLLKRRIKEYFYSKLKVINNLKFHCQV